MSEIVVIPVHNQVAYLKKCVASVYEKSHNPKVIIVDDGSTCQETKEWIIDNEKVLGYHIITHNEAMGFSKACNDGIEYALSNYDFSCLCLLNSDAEIETDDWFRKVQWFFDNGDKVGVASVMSNNALAQTVNPESYLRVIDKKPTVTCILCHGFCYFIGKELLLDFGMFDEDLFPHYGSEDDLSLESLKLGYQNLLVGSVFVWHENNASYSHAQREIIVRKSLPDLHKKWGKYMVNKCSIQTIKACKYVKNK